MNIVTAILFIVFCLKITVDGISSAIPDHLVQCYKRNYTSTVIKPPLTIQLLVELTRKVEWQEKDALNLRMFTTSLLHGIRFDGIQSTPGVSETSYTIPYRASGKQFYKYKLLVDYLTSGKLQLLPYESVTTKELCLLHEIISNTVHVWERGNEGRTCPELRSMSYQRDDEAREMSSIKKTLVLSRCPAESGVVKTRWGTISPGHLVAGVASALQESTMSLQQLVNIIQQDRNTTRTSRFANINLGNISNVWVSTVVGDLAEVTIQQILHKPKLGNLGTWNSTYLPRIHYLKDEPHDMTSAELLGGIDGAIFADKIKDWTSILSRTRFSQLLDMYYSNRGVAYDKSYRACERGPKLEKLFNSNELVQQTANVAKLLQEIGAANQYIDEGAIERQAIEVVKEFEQEAQIATTRYNACEQNIDKIQPLEVMVILDETWRGYKAEILVGALVEVVDVGFYGSTLGIINGQTGAWLTNVTHSLVQLYEDLYYVTKDSWQTSLRLTKGFESVISHLQNKTWRNCELNQRVPRSPVVLVMANSDSLRDDDMYTSQLALQSIKRLYPETKIIYITSIHNSNSYQQLAKQYANDVVIKISEYNEAVIPKIVKELTKVPSRIMDFYCNSSQLRMEDYVTPGVGKFYEIHREYVRRAKFLVKFIGNDYGEASICAYNPTKPEDKECRGLAGNDQVQFDADRYCPPDYSCNVQFSVTLTKTKYKCAEFDCRYPDQMRLDISTSWTSKSGSSAIRFNVYTFVLVLLALSFVNIIPINTF